MTSDHSPAGPTLRALVEAQLESGNASRRARLLADILLDKGSCTTTDLQELGFNHPPRAKGDLRDAGVDVVTIPESYIDGTTGRRKTRARYAIVGVTEGKQSRHPFSKATIDAVKASGRCAVCGGPPPLQVDHRVPVEITPERYPHIVDDLQPLDASCNRAKSWACEHCDNRTVKRVDVCHGCMWCCPANYTHIAMQNVRSLRGALTADDDVRRYDEQRPDVTNVVREWLEAHEGTGTEQGH